MASLLPPAPSGANDAASAAAGGASSRTQAATINSLQATKDIQIAKQEKSIGTVSQEQIMEKLKSIVSQDDPKALYSKIKKIGQG